MRNMLIIAGTLSTLFARSNQPVVDPYRIKAEAELELVFSLPAVASEPSPVPPKPQPKPDDKPKPKPGAATPIENIAKPRLQLLFFTDSENCKPCQAVKAAINELIQHGGYTTGLQGDICTIDYSQFQNRKLFRTWKVDCTPVLIIAEYTDESKNVAKEIGRHVGVKSQGMAEWMSSFPGEWRHGK